MPSSRGDSSNYRRISLFLIRATRHYPGDTGEQKRGCMSFPGRDRCEFPSQSENVFPVVGLMQAFVSSQADRIMPSGEDRNPDELRFCYTNSALFRTRQNNRVIGESFGPSETA